MDAGSVGVAVAELRFDGRVAVVTGAGRAIGRAHALLLAERGAKVVVNTRAAAAGTTPHPSSAHEVAREIVERGGEAIANIADVADPAAARSIVADALAAFDRIDIVINNAGILTSDDFETMPLEVLRRHIDVHLAGALNVTQAAWPRLVSQQYGRVIMTTSAGMLGVTGLAAYASAKAGLIGLMRNLAENGRGHGITVNAFAPAARTRFVGDPDVRRRAGMQPLGRKPEQHGEPEDVVPVVAFLVHESCTTTGEIFSATATNVARWFIGVTPGYSQRGITAESIRDHWESVCSEEGYVVPRNWSDLSAFRSELSERL
jgi:NAD(P)-dependent dehydrogenase (short-subunit alcohol dehydrogenase family)